APPMGAPAESTTFPWTTSPTSCANSDEDENRLTAIVRILETRMSRKMCLGFASKNLANPGKAPMTVLPDKASFVGLRMNFRICSLVFVKREDNKTFEACAQMARGRYGCIRSIVLF